MIAQMVSYEVPLMLSLLVPIMLAGSLSMQEIVSAQSGMWFFFLAPIACLIFLTAGQAEVGRAPFDLVEGESEIVAGHHIEYSGTAFAMFYLAEWLHAFTLSALTVTLFFGGWQGPGATDIPALGLLYFFAKTYVVYFVLNWLRYTVPRVRIDHMMSFNWKFLTPLALVMVVLTAFLEKLWPELFITDPDTVAFIQALPRTGILFLANIIVVGAVLMILREVARRARARVEGLVDEGEYSAPAPAVAEAEVH
jgi:NADH-quinone oxidoreductase subunit H